ncbi:lytic transglycosylase domain-containing protein [Qipengyuania sp. DGS5-3]|uniref:lytic transglycosylase domain-containing protein n=1 Tax=Qipengyuania sp. DGS5-3 TaxID=3349632 RepID=UPI0036D2C226
MSNTLGDQLKWCCRNMYNSARNLIAYIFVSTLFVCSAAQAKERQPEPIEDPGECPVDAPVRVASVDSLRHFEGLIGHCPETSLIESPAFRANRPLGAPDNVSIPSSQLIVPDRQADARLIIAKTNTRSADTRPSQTADRPNSGRQDKSAIVTKNATSARYSADGSSVAIVPPASAFVAPLGGETSAEAEAVLALRPQSYSTAFDAKIAQAARRHRVDPLLLHAVITQESRYRHRAVSHAGARGLMQVMPATGRQLGVRDSRQLFDPETNINAGAKLLSQLWRRFDGDTDLVLAAYNAGEGAVRKHGMQIPPYRETQDYVVKVKAIYTRLAGESGLAVTF